MTQLKICIEIICSADWSSSWLVVLKNFSSPGRGTPPASATRFSFS